MSISPSENRPILALPSSMPRWVAISCASAGLALPVKSTVLKSTVPPSRLAGPDHGPFNSAPACTSRRTGIQGLAGEEGLEPSHVGIKIRCLNQLGDSPTPVRGLRLEPLKLQPDAHPASGCCSKLRHILPTQPGGRSAGHVASGGLSAPEPLPSSALA